MHFDPELTVLQSELVDRLIAQVGQQLNLGTSHPTDVQLVERWSQIVIGLRQQGVQPIVFQVAWQRNFADWNSSQSGPPPIWAPTVDSCRQSNIGQWMEELGSRDYAEFHRWTIEHRSEFWRQAIDRLGIQFRQTPNSILDEALGPMQPLWLSGAQLNIVESCFQSPPAMTAIIAQLPGGPLRKITYAELRQQANRVSNSLADLGCRLGDAIAVVLPMTAWSVPIYLGIIQAGCVVVSIADSFAPPEIATRLKIANAKMVFTYDHQLRAGKKLPLFARVAEASNIPAIVLPAEEILDVDLRDQDRDWDGFLVERDQFYPIAATPVETINVLFSSGTTGEPKAIPWNHLTPIKCAIDGFCHQDIRTGNVCAWPTNLGWMMGPWLIFASLINRATIGLYEDAPTGSGFGNFVEQAQVNVLGVVPTIVKAWRAQREMEQFDWSAIAVFSSTGETSQAADMVYLSSLAGMKPIIEYCGGTEIGGGYITSTVCEPNFPAAFNTPAVGLDIVLLDETGQRTDEGELFLVPPSIGLSTRLVNRDHFETYYAGVPSVEGVIQLRRHGDHFRRLANGVYVAGGRVDDTMNLGGIKISSAEIERVLNQVDGVRETAAVAFSENGGPDELVVFVVEQSPMAVSISLSDMNQRLKTHLNPLFKIREIRVVDALPRTASGKVLRRELRQRLS